MERFPRAKAHEGIVVLRLEADLYFANVSKFKDKIQDIIKIKKMKNERLHGIVIDGSTFNYIDSTALHVLDSLLTELNAKGIKLILAVVRASVRDILQKSGITTKLVMDPKRQISDAITFLQKKQTE